MSHGIAFGLVGISIQIGLLPLALVGDGLVALFAVASMGTVGLTLYGAAIEWNAHVARGEAP